MVDGSRLGLDENIAATRKVVEMARAAGAPVEAELGMVLGHEEGPLPPYEELFASGRGFTDPSEAKRLVDETGADWLSVAIGNIHGAISAAARSAKKVPARLNVEHLVRIRQAAAVPLVLHGGSGIQKAYLRQAFRHGIAKINIGTVIRQAYESARERSQAAAERAVYDTVAALLTDELAVAGSAEVINPQ
ncbi:MAG: class II fructose-bisphosphate aldolase, partial [Planctomycetota bacterium]|jgi:fructose/tagatose bisphosphate aldolase